MKWEQTKKSADWKGKEKESIKDYISGLKLRTRKRKVNGREIKSK